MLKIQSNSPATFADAPACNDYHDTIPHPTREQWSRFGAMYRQRIR